MFLIKGNLWTLPAHIVCLTTNGFVKKDGSCVMGRGCAKEAKELWPGLDFYLGRLIIANGNHVQVLRDDPQRHVVSFPVKHNWWEEADLDLIEQSCQELQGVVNSYEEDYNIRRAFVALPRPVCGNGKLEWKDVKPICEKYLDDRFGVVTF